MKERIKKLRKDLHLTQQQFADRIGISRNNVATYEVGKSNPGEAVISLICRTFRVREEWLREGIEPMFSQPSGNAEQVREWLDGIFEKGSKFEQSFITAMSHFTDREWGILERFLIDLKAEQEAEDAAKPPAPAEASARFTEEELAAYRKVKAAMEQETFDAETADLHAELDRQREDEKRVASASSAGSSGTAFLIGKKILAASPRAQAEVIHIIEEDAK
ncbi:MAG: helix-turn-helix transcriptional regulator [Selenomonadaceae bacterium]|nr:helix-turn-helix transcriptional regulator [Selenomonadaceae bacterium]